MYSTKGRFFTILLFLSILMLIWGYFFFIERSIKVGVILNQYPFVFTSEKGQNIGLDIDIASEIKESHKTQVTIHKVQREEALQKLLYGDIDALMISALAGERYKTILEAVEPSYASFPLIVLSRRDIVIHSWEDLRNKRVCSILGSGINDVLLTTYDAEPLLFKENSSALDALKNGRCYAFLQKSISSDLVDKTSSAFNHGFLKTHLNQYHFYYRKDDHKVRDFLEEAMADLRARKVLDRLLNDWGSVGKGGYSTKGDVIEKQPEGQGN